MERPYVFALFSVSVAAAVTGGMVYWAGQSPERVLIGLSGRHDPAAGSERLAACLDCHVPFVGSPGSRCLSPGCHGELATGSPPRDGKAMPIRFHAALRDQPCGMCHVEHTPKTDVKPPPRVFSHALVPEDARAACNRCHGAAKVKDHNRNDAVGCKLCHVTERWKPTQMEHGKVWQHGCDVCHVAPQTPTHASVAGTCSACHGIEDWNKPKPPVAQ